MDKLYTIQEVATKLNLSDKTLRRWEEAGKFSSSRTLGNQRRYSLEDLQILDALKHGTITQQKDLLTLDQASQLCGVSPTTFGRWENDGKIHPFITSAGTYYPRPRLMEKMDELKKTMPEPVYTPYTPGVKGAHTPGVSSLEGQTLQDTPKRTVSQGAHLAPYLAHTLISLLLIMTYHLFFNTTPKSPLTPQSPSVQGASTFADPRLDVLEIKLREHLQQDMLEKAKAPTPTTIQAGSATLPKNQNQISVTNDKILPTTLVTISFNTDYTPAKKYWVTQETGSFTLHTDFPVAQDSSFNYILL